MPNTPQLLTYHSEAVLEMGTTVAVPFRSGVRVALVVGTTDRPTEFETRSVIQSHQKESTIQFGEKFLHFSEWIARYHGIPVSQVLRNGVPNFLVPPLQDGYMYSGSEALPEPVRKKVILAERKFWLRAKDFEKAANELNTEDWHHYPRIDGQHEWDPQAYLRATPRAWEDNAHLSGSAQQKKFFQLLLERNTVPIAAIDDIYANPKTKIRDFFARGWVLLEEEPDPPSIELISEEIILSEEQQEAYRQISASSDTTLLFGPTGAGKTEVMAAVARMRIEEGGQVLFLAPEIGQATQLFRRLQKRFEGKCALYHSALSDSKRRKVAQLCSSGDVKLLIGARSALFAPLPKLSQIIVDEEHELAFKAPDSPYFHGRNLAVQYARICNIPCLLASATPSAETWKSVESKRFRKVELATPYTRGHITWKQINLPRKIPKGQSPVQGPWVQAVEEALSRNEQVAFLRTMRGRYRHTRCTHCGAVQECENCEGMPLVQHNKGSRTVLQCHFCQVQHDLGTHTCTQCSHKRFERRVAGTQQWEEWLQKRFPEAEVIRIDRDAVNGSQGWIDLYNTIATGSRQILVGTQSLAKGFDLPNLSTLICSHFDDRLQVPDPRAWEHAAALLVQAAGRVGRRGQSSTVFIDADTLEHPVYQAAISNQYIHFLNQELQKRQKLSFPPFSYAAQIYGYYRNRPAFDGIAELAKSLRKALPNPATVRILEPDFGDLDTGRKLAGSYRTETVLLCESAGERQQICETIRANYNKVPSAPKEIRINYDPIQLS